jgi:lipoate synthase
MMNETDLKQIERASINALKEENAGLLTRIRKLEQALSKQNTDTVCNCPNIHYCGFRIDNKCEILQAMKEDK